jgi:hypothetical protein
MASPADEGQANHKHADTPPPAPCPGPRGLQPAEAACVSIFDGPYNRARKQQLRAKLQDPVDCTDVVGALQHILFAAVLNAEKHRQLSVRWSRLHYLLGLPAAIATSVGAIGLSSNGTIGNAAAYIVLASGIFSASLTFLRCAELRDRNGSLCAGWTALADCVRITLFAYQEDKDNGLKAATLKRRYRQRLIELNQEKMQLLWGVLRAGPTAQKPAPPIPGGSADDEHAPADRPAAGTDDRAVSHLPVTA